jgi:hypothetical protein
VVAKYELDKQKEKRADRQTKALGDLSLQRIAKEIIA